jgi:hypothetical protein
VLPRLHVSQRPAALAAQRMPHMASAPLQAHLTAAACIQVISEHVYDMMMLGLCACYTLMPGMTLNVPIWVVAGAALSSVHSRRISRPSFAGYPQQHHLRGATCVRAAAGDDKPIQVRQSPCAEYWKPETGVHLLRGAGEGHA